MIDRSKYRNHGELFSRLESEYIGDDTIERLYEGGGIYEQTITVHDNGNIKEKSTFSKYDLLKEKREYTYLDDGNIYEGITHYSNNPLRGTVISKSTSRNKYDKSWNIIEEDLLGFSVYDYNEKGHVSKKTVYNSSSMLGSGTEYLFEYEYDDRGNWIKKTGKKSGKIVSKIERDIEYFSDWF